LIIDASADYTRLTGKDLSKDPFATLFKHSNSPEAILELLQRRNNAFEEYQDGNQRVINSLGPTVRVLQAFSRVLGEVVSLVSDTCHLVSPLT
jgi:fungal STAND N-terminal Goodbye domain